jgi:hypothetical protein
MSFRQNLAYFSQAHVIPVLTTPPTVNIAVAECEPALSNRDGRVKSSNFGFVFMTDHHCRVHGPYGRFAQIRS